MPSKKAPTAVDEPAPVDQTTGHSSGDPASRARVWTLVVTCLSLLLVMSSMVGLNTALGDIALQTSASQSQLTWIVDSYTLVLACLLLPAGAIGDRYGRRGALVFGLVVFAIASVAPIFWADPATLITARGAAGVGAAFVMPATLSLITTAYPKEERTKAVGIWAGVSGAGGIIGMLGSGLLLHFWSWPSIFWAFAAAAIALVLLALTIASSKEAEPKPLDWPGAVLIGAAVGTFVFGILEAPARGWTDPLVYGGLITGVVLAAAFAAVELRRTHPLLDVRLFGNVNFATGSATVTVLFLALFGFFYLIMQYVQLVMGYSAIQTAIAISPLAVPMLILSATSFWYVPRLGLRLVILVGLLLISAGFGCLRVLEIGSPYWHLAWPLLVLSCGIGLSVAPTTAAIMVSVPDDKQGVASAVNDAAREIGAALGIALAGSILATRYTETLTPHLTGLPAPVQSAAARSRGEALGAAEQLGPAGAALVDASRTAFLRAMESSLLTLAIVIGVGGVLIAAWAPGRDGSQLAVVRRLASRGAASRADEPPSD